MVNDARGLGELPNPSVRMSIVVTVRSFDGLDLPIQTDLDHQIKMESPQLGSAPSREDNEETTEFPRKNKDKSENRGFDNSPWNLYGSSTGSSERIASAIEFLGR